MSLLPFFIIILCEEASFDQKRLWFVPDLEVLRSFQNQIAAIQRDAVWWLHTVVPTISKVGPKDYVHWSVTSNLSINC